MGRKERYFEGFRRKAEEIIEDRQSLNSLLIRARSKMDQGRDKMTSVMDKVNLFFRMLKAYAKGEYRNIATGKVVLIIAAFLYLVSPIDAVMDFLPGGLIDDAAIFLWLFNSLKDEIEAFRLWEEERG